MGLFESFRDPSEGFRSQLLRVVAQGCWPLVVKEVEAAPPKSGDADGNDGAEEGVAVCRRGGMKEGETE